MPFHNRIICLVSASAKVPATVSSLVMLVVVVAVVLISVLVWKKYKGPQHRYGKMIELSIISLH